MFVEINDNMDVLPSSENRKPLSRDFNCLNSKVSSSFTYSFISTKEYNMFNCKHTFSDK